MNAYGGSRGIAAFILNSGTRCRCVANFRPRSGTHWIGGWVGPTAGLDVLETRKISCPYWNLKPQFLCQCWIHFMCTVIKLNESSYILKAQSSFNWHYVVTRMCYCHKHKFSLRDLMFFRRSWHSFLSFWNVTPCRLANIHLCFSKFSPRRLLNPEKEGTTFLRNVH